ncbi:MAG: proteasome-activating nucleotidase [Candidatus Lokiarchaeota archaeon]|nr:proteasome-activating nucleotidase [Candidatus Lokiarchaeota archaeon]
MSTLKKNQDDSEDDEKRANDNYLITYTRHLERRLRSLETEKQLLETERLRLDKELHTLRNELDRLRQPPLIGATVTDILEDDRVVVKSSTGPQFIVNVSRKITTKELEPGMRVALNQRNFAVMEIMPESMDPLVQGMELIDTLPDVSYNDIGGLEEQITEVKETVELPLLYPELFESVGVKPPKGVLLYGEPGTGKTLTAKAVAHETKARFIRIIGSELVQKFIGEGARMVREIFQLARKKAPSIIFIDELDAIGSQRLQVATSGDREVQRTLMQLLSELDGFDDRGDVRIIAATNRFDILDPALLRPGRFDRIIKFPLPKEEDRLQIFKIHSKNLKLEKNVNFKQLVQKTENATGAEINAICIEAGMIAIRAKKTIISMEDFEVALEKVLSKKQVPKNLYS